MLDVVHRQVELVIMLSQLAAIFRFTIRQNPQYGDVLVCKVRQHFVVEQVGLCDWRLRCIEPW